jgi:hypothetical protein
VKVLRNAPLVFLAFISLSLQPALGTDDDEVSLFDDNGKAVAYIAPSDEMTIYLWSGKPVAYLKIAGDVLNVYGFNGEHLGWLVKDVVWGHSGNAACATKDVMKDPALEPFKSFKQFKPFKSFTKFAPARPAFTGEFGEVPCGLLLASGGK